MTARAEALSDGVFAIAMTLLVLEIRVPAGETGLAAALVQQWAAIAAFAVSFLYLGVYWLNHFIASRVTRVDGPFLALNLVFLIDVSGSMADGGWPNNYAMATFLSNNTTT